MKRSDIKVGDVLGWVRYGSTDEETRDNSATPVRIVDLEREVPIYQSRRVGSPTPTITGYRTAIFAQGLKADLNTVDGRDEFEVTTRNLVGLWYDITERRTERRKAAEAREAALTQREDAWIAVHDLIGELSDPGLRRGMLETRGRGAGRVSINIDDLLALIKAARTAALNEYEGTGGRND